MPLKKCETCSLAIEKHAHLTLQDCIRGMRAAMHEQRAVAQRMGMDMSLHFLRALEELALDADVGFRYTVKDPITGENNELPAQAVSGIFASLLKKYREVSDFPNEEKEKKAAAHWAMVAGQLAGNTLMLIEKYAVDSGDKEESRRLIEEAQVTPDL